MQDHGVDRDELPTQGLLHMNFQHWLEQISGSRHPSSAFHFRCQPRGHRQRSRKAITVSSLSSISATCDPLETRCLLTGSEVFRQIGADIVGAIGGDHFGVALAISDDGNTVVASGQYGDIPGAHVRVLRSNGRQWSQLGSGFSYPGNEFARTSVSISSDGNTIALGEYAFALRPYTSPGRVRILHFDGSDWSQLGTDIIGEAEFDGSGRTVSLSDDGQTVAIGAPSNSGNGEAAGHVRVFSLIDGNWIQVGQDIDGEDAIDLSATSLSLSGDGQTVAVGTPNNDGNGDFAGHARVFRLTNGTWNQLGADFDGAAPNVLAGTAIALNQDGNTLAVSYPRASDRGLVRVFQFDGSAWAQRGESIEGALVRATGGQSLSLSDDGLSLAIAGLRASALFRWDGVQWRQVGQTLSTNSDSSTRHPVVALTGDGRALAVSDPADDIAGERAGLVKVFALDDSSEPLPEVTLSVSTISLSESNAQPITISAVANSPVVGDQTVDVSFVGARIRETDFTLADAAPMTPEIQILIPDGAQSGSTTLTIHDNDQDEADKLGTVTLSTPSSGVVIGDQASSQILLRNDDFLPALTSPIGGTEFGEAEFDGFGFRVAVSADGSTVVSGARGNDRNGRDAGHVRILRTDGSTWNQIGADLYGDAEGDAFGSSVAISSNGNTVAIGAPQFSRNTQDPGYARIFAFSDGGWTQIGSDIVGIEPDDWHGATLSLSENGRVIAVGAPNASEGHTRSGQVRLYQFDGSEWMQMGAPITGSRRFGRAGADLSLSGDGTTLAISDDDSVKMFRHNGATWTQVGETMEITRFYSTVSDDRLSLNYSGDVLAIGAPQGAENGIYSGDVQVHRLVGSNWIQVGQLIEGDEAFDESGTSVSISDDGMTLAIGSPRHGNLFGQVRIFRFTGAEWIRLGADIDATRQENVGASVSLSGDGSLIAVGVPDARAYIPGFPQGAVRVFQILPDGDPTIRLSGPDTFYVTHSGNTVIVRDSVGQVVASRFIGSEPIRILGSPGDDRIVFETPVGDATGDPLITIEGQGGDDLIDARNSRNAVSLVGGTGHDTLLGSHGDDTLAGSAGDDSILGFAGNDRIKGGIGNDTLRGGAHRDTLAGEAGDDVLRGNGSSGDVLSGGEGNDLLNGDAGSDLLVEAGDTNFVLTDTTLTGLGDDQVVGIESARLSGGRSANRIDASGFSGPTVQVGYAGNDTLIGGSASDILRGSAGRDRLIGNSGNDRLFGQGSTGDWLIGGPGDDLLNGGSGNDVLVAEADANFVLTGSLLTGDGRDIVQSIERAVLTGGRNANRIDASAFTGETTLSGLGGNDTIIGGAARDVIRGAGGRDNLLGMGGDDWLFGQGSSGDRLDGGPGSDRLDGGKGADRITSDGIDTIIEDVLDTILDI